MKPDERHHRRPVQPRRPGPVRIGLGVFLLPLVLLGTVEAGVVLESPRVFDPEMGGGATLDCRFRVDGVSKAKVEIQVLDGPQEVARLHKKRSITGGKDYQVSWDGRNKGKQTVDPGTYTLRLVSDSTAGLEEVTRSLHVVRLGFVQIRLIPAPGGRKIPLTFHGDAMGPGGRYPVAPRDAEWVVGRKDPAEAGDLDADDGTPRPAPAPWADLAHPPLAGSSLATDARNLPACFRVGSPLEAEIVLGADAVSSGGVRVSAGYPIAGLPITVLTAGGTRSDPLDPGATVTVPLDDPVRDTIGRETRAPSWRFQVEIPGGGFEDIPGEIRSEHTLYGTLGTPPAALGLSGPWVAVLDTVVRWADGLKDPAAAAAAVTKGVYEDLDLRYDDYAGAPFYTYGPLDDTGFELDAFLARVYGKDVNCTDCAAIVASHAGTLGIDTRLVILGQDFALNYILPIGSKTYTDDPFGVGFGGFSFHALISTDAGRNAFDATLALDGDLGPDRPPHTVLLPDGLPMSRYLDALTPDMTVTIQILARIHVP